MFMYVMFGQNKYVTFLFPLRCVCEGEEIEKYTHKTKIASTLNEARILLLNVVLYSI